MHVTVGVSLFESLAPPLHAAPHSRRIPSIRLIPSYLAAARQEGRGRRGASWIGNLLINHYDGSAVPRILA
jgi:hypothetical protein